MTVISCKRKKYGRHKAGAGCYICGGYGNIAIKQFCGCGKWGWFRENRGMTVYDGKQYNSIDGLEWVYHEGGGHCIHCHEAKCK